MNNKLYEEAMYLMHGKYLYASIGQAKHDKSGLSSKLPIEFQWSIFEIGKSLREK